MTGMRKSAKTKAILGLVVMAFFIAAPRSLAVDLLSPIIGTVDGTSEPSAPTPTPTDTPSQSPSPQPSAAPSSSSAPSQSPPSNPIIDTATASASPSPIQPQAIETQTMRLALPTVFSVDPRAHSVFIPQIKVSGVENLLICGYTNAASLDFTTHLPGVESHGSGSSTFRISGPANLVAAAFNGDLGARLQSNSNAISGKVISLAFIAVNKPSINPALCNDGNASNTRTISFRAMNMDLNMVKDGVRLK